VITFDTEPDAYYYMRYVDQYGLPEKGGWLDQPLMFMREIEAARRAVRAYERENKE